MDNIIDVEYSVEKKVNLVHLLLAVGFFIVLGAVAFAEVLPAEKAESVDLVEEQEVLLQGAVNQKQRTENELHKLKEEEILAKKNYENKRAEILENIAQKESEIVTDEAYIYKTKRQLGVLKTRAGMCLSAKEAYSELNIHKPEKRFPADHYSAEPIVDGQPFYQGGQ